MYNFGFDIDDVIFKTSEVLMKVLDECDDDEILKHKLDIMRGDAVNKKIGDFLKENVIPAIKAAKPMKNASQVIKKIKESNRIILITARGDKLFPSSEEITITLLKKYGIEYDDIIFNCMDKVKICKDYDIKLFVDDSPKHCLEVRDSLKITVLGFYSDINREEMLRKHINCVSSWNELYNVVRKILK